MDLQEIKTYLTEHANDTEIKTYLEELTKVTTDKAEAFLSTEDGKKLLQPKLDSYATKAINSHDEKFKANELPKLIEAEITKRNPSQDPKDKVLAEMQAKLDKMEADGKRKELQNLALKTANEKKLPTEVIDFFIGQNEQTTIDNLTALEKVFTPHIEKLVKERLGDGYIPPKNDTPPTTKNPWSKENFNLTEQGKLLKENPTLASQLMAQAKN